MWLHRNTVDEVSLTWGTIGWRMFHKMLKTACVTQVTHTKPP